MSQASTPGGETPPANAPTPTTTTPTTPPSTPTHTTPPTAPVTQDVTTGQDPDGEGDETFDRERAMRTIKQLREKEKAATAAQKELETLRADKQKRDDADLSERDRLAKEKERAETERDQLKRDLQERTNRYEVQIQASRLGIVDPDAAVRLLDWDQLGYDADGRPVDVDKALKQLVKDRPYLAGAPAAQVAATNGATRQTAPGARTYSAAELADRAFYVAHREDIVKAMREGRVTQ